VQLKRAEKGLKEQLFLRLPISVYFGWLTIATIANTTTFLVSINFNGFGIPETVWTAAVLAAATIIGALNTIKSRDAAYGLVFVWAFTGILLKHTSPGVYNSQYPLVVTSCIAAIAVMAVSAVIALILALRKKKTA